MWLAVDKKGIEYISNDMPTFDGFEWVCMTPIEVESEKGYFNNIVIAPNGTIEKILGKELTFKESPLEIYIII